MYKSLITTTPANYNGHKFIILTFLLEHRDGLALEYWYMLDNYGIMRLAYGEMLKDNDNIAPDLEYIADTIDWEALEDEM